MTGSLQDRLLSAIFDADRSLANELIDDWASVHGYRNALIELVSPVLEKIGEAWSGVEEISLAQSYIAGKVADDIVTKVENSQESTAEGKEAKGPVVMGNIEDDYHPLGRKMVVTFLRVADWKVFDLGNDVMPNKFVDTALEVGACVIGASAMMYTNAVNIKKIREEIDNRGLTGYLQLAVGGAVFKLRPKLVQEVGGDGTARDATRAPALMDELWKNSSKKGEKR